MLKQIGKYTIVERIGRGTYSRVYRAVDSQGRSVAIKISTTQTEPQHLEEFQKDLVNAASVLHPNLVAVHDLGFEDEFPYLVMELAEGLDLDRILKSNAAPSLADRIRVMQQAGGALQAAHERGVFHLDVRPSKIMLAGDGGTKLLDLGLGRLSFDPARVTEYGYLVGAPFYMSPERLTAIDTADERCDIWAFGVTFYEWICGRHPFYDDDGDRMIGNIMDAVPVDLQNVPPKLNQTIMRALQKDPAQRYRSFTELLADLQPLVTSLKREESDALMSEALKQTDSGQWREARRIARHLRQSDPQRAQSSQYLGVPEEELAEDSLPESANSIAQAPLPSPVQEPLVIASAGAAAAALLRESPQTAPSLEPIPEFGQPMPVTPPAAARPRGPQRPERTAPKIPPMGMRGNIAATAATAAEQGSPASTRAQQVPPPPPATNATFMAASATAGAAQSSPVTRPAVVREVDTAPKPQPRVDRPRTTRRESQPQAPVSPSQSSRILEMPEPSGLPWVRILGFVIPAVLLLGALFFFLRPVSKTKSSPEDAKEVSGTGRVIKPSGAPAPKTPIDPKATATTSGTGADPNTTTTLPDGTDLATVGDPLSPQPARSFDPKTLTPIKTPAPSKRKGNAPLVGVAAPSLPAGNEGQGIPTLQLAINAPPPPAPATAPPPAPVKAAPTQAPTAPTPMVPAPVVQSVEAARAAATHIGGMFAQPVLVKTVQPVYPPAAVQRRAQGTVRFQATIAKDGSVKNIQLLSGDPLLNVAARQAVAQWKYRPAMLNGDAIEVTQAIVVNFNLNNK